MNTPQERLKHFVLMTFRKQKEFAEKMNIYPGDIAKYTKPDGSIFQTPEKISKLTELGLNINWYFTGEGEMLLADTNDSKKSLSKAEFVEPTVQEPTTPTFAKVDRIEFLPVPANEGKEYYFQPSSIFYEVTTQYARDNFKVVRLTGNDLSPVLTPDTLLIIDVNRPVKYGKYVVGTIADILVCRRYEYDAIRKQDILTTNAQPYKIDNYSDFKLLGVVVEARITFL